MQLPSPGTHQGQMNGQIVIYETAGGALCAAIPIRLTDGAEVAWQGKHTVTLVKKDGTVQTRSVQGLKEIFGWDGQDPFWLSEQDFGEILFDLVCEHEAYVPENSEDQHEVTVFKVKYMNPLGGSARMPEAADRKSVLAKYGNKFRALAGAKTAKPSASPIQAGETPASEAKPAAAQPAAKKTNPPAPAKKPALPAAKTAGGQPVTATMEEAWEALQKAYPNKSEAEQGEVWYQELETLFPGKTNTDLTIQEWGQLKNKFESAAK